SLLSYCSCREPPKNRGKTTKTAEVSIVPEDGAPTRMCFPPSQSLETTTRKKGKHVNSSTATSKSKSLENTDKKGKGGKSESV
uniref:Uncharacterized protein n=1 Tax=Triticum urartu TaxID=4572 RepID=A0A8R7USF8_TRIUA